MDKFSNIQLNKNKEISQLCLSKNITTYQEAFKNIHNLPYGRSLDRSNFKSIIKDQKGTCSTKHAFLKALAIENDIKEISLWIGIYKMNAENTNGINDVLNNYNLSYIPEAHCYLKLEGKRYDITFPEESSLKFESSLLTEVEIVPEQIGEFKLKMHKDYLKKWMTSSNLQYSFEDIWSIREACIMALQNT